MGRAVVCLDPLRYLLFRSPVDLTGPFHPDSFVWAYLVEFFPKPIELLLLGSKAAGRRDGGLLLQCPVHSLVHPILLRLPRLNQLGVNAQLDEPQ